MRHLTTIAIAICVSVGLASIPEARSQTAKFSFGDLSHETPTPAPNVESSGHFEMASNATYTGDVALPRGVLSGGLEFEIQIKLSGLMNEPVINCGAHWAPDPLSKVSISGNFPQGKQFVLLDDEQRQKLQFYDLNVALSFLIPGGQTAYILCDAGIVGHGDQEPFNVASSPNWDRLICVSRFWDLSDCVADRPGAWVAEAQSRELYRELLASHDDHYMRSLKIISLRANAGAAISDIIDLQRSSGMLATMTRHAKEVNAAVNEAAGQDLNLLAEMLANFPPIDASNQTFPEIYKETLKYAHFARVFTSAEELMEFAGPNGADSVKAILATTEPLKQRHTAEREAAKQAYDEWSTERQRIVNESDMALDTYRNGLEAPKHSQSRWYEVARDGAECYFVHPVTRERAFVEETFSRCLLASTEQGWRIAKLLTPSGTGDAHMEGGPFNPVHGWANAGIFSSGYAWASDFNEACLFFTPDGRIADLPGMGNLGLYLSCRSLLDGESETISVRTFENECMYFDVMLEVVDRYSLGKSTGPCRDYNP